MLMNSFIGKRNDAEPLPHLAKTLGLLFICFVVEVFAKKDAVSLSSADVLVDSQF